MTEEVTLGNKSCQRRLCERRSMLVGDRANSDHRFYQFFRGQNVAQAQRWIENLTHGARVDDSPTVIQPLQARKRRAGKTKFRVMIVLKDVSITGMGKVDQSRPARETHR